MKTFEVKDENGKSRWFVKAPDGKPIEISAGARGMSIPKGNNNNAVEISNDRSAYAAADRERELQMRGEASRQRAEEAKNTPWHKQAILAAGDETKSLLSGIRNFAASDIGDIVKMAAGNIILPGQGDRFIRSAEAREKDAIDLESYNKNRNIEKEMFREMREETGLPSIARILPYLATSALEAPITAGYRTGLKAITDITRKNKPISINATGRPTILPEYAGAATLGSIEGSLHDEETAGQGVLSSILGKFGGRQIGNYLEKAPNENSKFDNDLVSRWRKKGYNASPGMRTGNQKEQRNDSVQQSDPRFSGWYDERDRVNDAVLLKEIKNSAGFGKDGIGELNTLSPGRINSHIDSLKKEYGLLEANTKGKIPSSEFINIRNLIDRLPDQDINRIRKDFVRFTGSNRDESGKLKISDRFFDGSGYQNELRRLKDAKARAVAEVNKPLADVYDSMMLSLASGLEGGMKKHQVERWRDLNERWAMSKLIIDKGLDSTNKIDTRKLLDNISRSDSERLVTGKGGRIRGFHDVVRMKELESQQKTLGMGEGIAELSESAKKSREKSKPTFYSGPEKSKTTPINNALMNFQYDGLFGQPRKVYGLLGNPSEGILSTGSVMRSAEQGTDAKLNLLGLVDNKAKMTKNYVEKLWKGQ